MSLHEDKTIFLRYEVGILSLKASLSTRAGDSPIYSSHYKEYQREPFKEALRKELQILESKYSNGRIDETAHSDYIEALANRISQSHSQYLNGGRLRFGVAQKLVNLHLKYLWVMGLIEEPPHCPLDGIVRDLAKLNYDWVTSDSRSEYENAIVSLTQFAHPRSLSVWELQEFKRRGKSVA